MAMDLSEFYFDERTAAIAVAFFEKLLHHSKGEWAGSHFSCKHGKQKRSSSHFLAGNANQMVHGASGGPILRSHARMARAH